MRGEENVKVEKIKDNFNLVVRNLFGRTRIEKNIDSAYRAGVYKVIKHRVVIILRAIK